MGSISDAITPSSSKSPLKMVNAGFKVFTWFAVFEKFAAKACASPHEMKLNGVVVAVAVGVNVLVAVAVEVEVTVGVKVFVAVAVGVNVLVAVAVGVEVAVAVNVLVAVAVGLEVLVTVAVGVAVAGEYRAMPSRTVTACMLPALTLVWM
jgi:hypothetical protein